MKGLNFFKAIAIAGTALSEAAEAAKDGKITTVEILHGGATLVGMSGLPINDDKLKLAADVLSLIDKAQDKGMDINAMGAFIIPALKTGIEAATETLINQAANKE